MTTIYRVEHAVNGHGPYRYGHYDRPAEMDRLECHSYGKLNKGRPVFCDDFMGKVIPPNCIAGFNSLKCLRWWFKGFMRLLQRNGFIIRIYSVPSAYVYIGKSKHQVAFLKCSAAQGSTTLSCLTRIKKW